MIEISTPQQFLDFLVSDDIENAEAILLNNIDFCTNGQITSEIKIIGGNKLVLDLNGFSLLNIYPILSNFIYSSNQFHNVLKIKNGFIPNLLLSNGHMISIDLFSSLRTGNYNKLFTTSRIVISFENIGFSILGCNFYDNNFYKSAVCSMISLSNFSASIAFDRCSFYIKTRRTLPMMSDCIYRNCSFYFDSEYDTLTSCYSDNDLYQTGDNAFYFCVIKGKIKKSENFEYKSADVQVKNTLGELINCYVDLETDIPNMFINVDLSKDSSYYQEIMNNPFTTDISSMTFGNDTVYNIDKYSAVVEEGQNNQMVIGGKALTDAQMQDADYLLVSGFLAVDEGETNDV